MSDLRIEPGTSDDTVCACCGDRSRIVRGFVYRDGDAAAMYLVHWTLGHVPEHGAHVDLFLGIWGDGTTPSDRSVVSLEFRRTASGPAFMVIDATDRPAGKGGLGRPLKREAVIGTALARHAFDVVDAIWAQDDRIREIVGVPG